MPNSTPPLTGASWRPTRNMRVLPIKVFNKGRVQNKRFRYPGALFRAVASYLKDEKKWINSKEMLDTILFFLTTKIAIINLKRTKSRLVLQSSKLRSPKFPTGD